MLRWLPPYTLVIQAGIPASGLVPPILPYSGILSEFSLGTHGYTQGCVLLMMFLDPTKPTPRTDHDKVKMNFVICHIFFKIIQGMIYQHVRQPCFPQKENKYMLRAN